MKQHQHNPKSKLSQMHRLKSRMAKTRGIYQSKDNLTFMWGVILELDQNQKLPIIPYPEGDVTIQDLKGESA